MTTKNTSNTAREAGQNIDMMLAHRDRLMTEKARLRIALENIVRKAYKNESMPDYSVHPALIKEAQQTLKKLS